MRPLWAALALGCTRCGVRWSVDLEPQLASIMFATNNPTLTTITLEKPFCMFKASVPQTDSYKVNLYVMVNSGSIGQAAIQDNRSFPINSTFFETAGGQRGPYKAASFIMPQCEDLPNLDEAGDVNKAAEILSAYLVRVGGDTYCLLDPNFEGTCNPPLTRATEYRFKYVLVNTSSGFVEDQTLWSQPIWTNQISPYSEIDTWPGRRSGAMIVITSILSTLVFFLLLGFAAAVVFSFLGVGSSDLETQHETQISQDVVPKVQGPSEPFYSSVNRRQSLDRAEVCTSKLQD
ncbi:uroplakin-3a isoform X2 [Dromiciops gliroides]|uniref:uroplakin-3a isoform X2 n=1 Tax=Dromiciops gliroides TaxID=33562 RepID=UPI001CC63A6F|nr:uroplakin-3a isoform X2 [Dromiciops gliroides]